MAWLWAIIILGIYNKRKLGLRMEAAVIFAQILYGLAAAFCLVYYLPCALYWGWYGRELTAVLLVGLGSAAALGATAYFGMTVILWTVFASRL